MCTRVCYEIETLTVWRGPTAESFSASSSLIHCTWYLDLREGKVLLGGSLNSFSIPKVTPLLSPWGRFSPYTICRCRVRTHPSQAKSWGFTSLGFVSMTPRHVPLLSVRRVILTDSRESFTLLLGKPLIVPELLQNYIVFHDAISEYPDVLISQMEPSSVRKPLSMNKNICSDTA